MLNINTYAINSANRHRSKGYNENLPNTFISVSVILILFPSIFVAIMVGLDTLELRRKLQLDRYYCLILRGKINNPTIISYSSISTSRCHRRLFVMHVTRMRHANNASTQGALALIVFCKIPAC